MRAFLKYFKKYRLISILSPLFKFLEASFELLVPFVISDIIDIGISTKDNSYIISRVIIMGVFAILGLIFAISAQYFAAKTSSGVASDIRRDLFSRIESLSPSSFDKIGKNTLITNLTSDINQIGTGINLFLRLLLRSPFIVFGSVIMAFTIDYSSALIFLSILLVLSAVIVLNLKLSLPLMNKTKSEIDNMVSHVGNSISGVKVIRAFGRTNDDRNDFNRLSVLIYNIQRKSSFITSLLNPATYLIVNVAIVCLVFRGDISIESGSLTTGQVVALYNYLCQILVELLKLSNLIITISKSITSWKRVNKVLLVEEPVNENSLILDSSPSHEITFNNVSYSYDSNSEDVITDISFKIKRGERIGIIGLTGSGKSSIVKLMCGLYKASKGEILIDGININDLSYDSLYSELSVCLQKPKLFNGTISSNVSLGREEIDDNRIKEALVYSALDNWCEDSASGLQREIFSSGSTISGGQRQRLTIARTLAPIAGVYIFDDSFSSLDANTEKRIVGNLMKLPNDPTIVVVSQKVSVVKDLDRIIFLEDGEISFFDTHESLLTKSSSYRELCKLQEMDGI